MDCEASGAMTQAEERRSPRGVLLRASMEEAERMNHEPKLLATSPNALDTIQAYELLRAFAEGADPLQSIFQGYGHENASNWLFQTEATPEAFVSDDNKLIAAATMCAAEFQSSRNFAESSIEEYIFKVLVAANARLTGGWRGRQLGIIGFLYEEALGYGVAFNGTFISHGGWGLCPGAPT